MEHLKRRTYELLVEPPDDDVVARAVSLSILALIGANVIVSVAETEPTLSGRYPRFFFIFELVSVIIFTIEYVSRLWACTYDPKYKGAFVGRLKKALETMSLIDLLAIAPFYLQVVLPGLDLRFVRALRLFRLFRVFKVGRYAESFAVLAKVVRQRREELAIATAIVLIMVVLSASAMWLCEHEAQPERFRSVPQAMWWAVVTVTTIGYGDVTPVTTAGRIVGGVVAYLGICIFALPVGILGGAFIEEMEQQRKRKRAEENLQRREDEEGGPVGLTCPHCGKRLDIDVTKRS